MCTRRKTLHASDVHVAVLSQNADIASDLRPCAMAKALAGAGYVVSLVAPRQRPDARPAIEDRRVRLLGFPLPVPAEGAVGQVREQTQATLRAARVLVRLARTSPIHVLHAGNPPDNGWLFLPLLRAVQGFAPAFVYDQHDPAPLLVAEKFGRRRGMRAVESALSALEAASFRLADLVVFANEPFRRRAEAIDRLRGAAVIAPNGWSLAFRPKAAVLPWRDPSLALVAYVGTTNAQDCIDHLVETVAAVQVPIQIVVAGDGDARLKADELARALGVAHRFVWLGWVTDRSLIARLILEAAVCIAPETRSPANDITSFVKVIEYMSVGAPIVAHRLAQTELLAGNAIEYATDDSPAALAAAIERLVLDPTLSAARADAARRRFDTAIRWENIGAPRLVEAYESVVLPRIAARRPATRRFSLRRTSSAGKDPTVRVPEVTDSAQSQTR